MPTKIGNGHNVDLQKLMEDIRVVVEDGQNLLRAGATEVKHRAVAGARSTDKLVRGYPYQTLGIAFGVGILVGLLATRAMRGEAEEEEE